MNIASVLIGVILAQFLAALLVARLCTLPDGLTLPPPANYPPVHATAPVQPIPPNPCRFHSH